MNGQSGRDSESSRRIDPLVFFTFSVEAFFEFPSLLLTEFCNNGSVSPVSSLFTRSLRFCGSTIFVISHQFIIIKMENAIVDEKIPQNHESDSFISISDIAKSLIRVNIIRRPLTMTGMLIRSLARVTVSDGLHSKAIINPKDIAQRIIQVSHISNTETSKLYSETDTENCW